MTAYRCAAEHLRRRLEESPAERTSRELAARLAERGPGCPGVAGPCGRDTTGRLVLKLGPRVRLELDTCEPCGRQAAHAAAEGMRWASWAPEVRP